MIYLTLLLLILAISYVGLLLFYAWAFQKIPNFNTQLYPQQLPPITVIVPARNEASNIVACLNSIAQQQYPAHKLHLIVIDDHSTDNTPQLVDRFIAQNPQLNAQLLLLAQHLSPKTHLNSYKKKALEVAIAHAQTNWIVTTDADCIAASPYWLATLLGFAITQNAVFVTAPVLFSPVKSLFDKFQALDFVGMMVTTAASVQHHLADMCNGANLAYQRTVFYEVNGFEGINHLASGDDMLLMAKISNHYPKQVMSLKSLEALVTTPPQPNITAFFWQRIRWASKSGAYTKWQTQAALLVVLLTNVACWAMLIYALVAQNKVVWAQTIAFFTVKFVADAIYLYTGCRFFKRTRWMYAFLPAQIIHLIYIAVVGISANFVRYNWKGRKVK